MARSAIRWTQTGQDSARTDHSAEKPESWKAQLARRSKPSVSISTRSAFPLQAGRDSMKSLAVRALENRTEVRALVEGDAGLPIEDKHNGCDGAGSQGEGRKPERRS